MSSELEDLLKKIQAFSDERDWSQFHTAKNLILAVSAEVGELAEVVQWKSDQEAVEYLKTPEGKNKLSEEVADVAIYLLRICQQQNLNFIAHIFITLLIMFAGVAEPLRSASTLLAMPFI